MDAALVMYRPDGDHRVFKLSKDATIIGRRADCDLRIPLGEISRKHCRIVKNGIGYSVEDMGSSNGTYVNGARVQSLELEPGDTVQMGPVAFVLQIDNEPATHAIKPIIAGPKPDGQAQSGSGGDDVELAGDADSDGLDILNANDSGVEEIDLSHESAGDVELPTQIQQKKR